MAAPKKPNESERFEFAIRSYIQDLQRDPTDIKTHEALRQVALRRKVMGGEPAGPLFPDLPAKNATPFAEMINAAWLLSHNPGNIAHMRSYLNAAKAAGYDNVVKWFEPTLQMAERISRRPPAK